MSLIHRRLQALGYPDRDKFDLNDEQNVRLLIAWLEDRKIRHLDVDERKPLRNFDPAWNDAAAKYLSDLGCPIQWDSERSHALSWLLSYAISLEYNDRADEINAGATKPAVESSGSGQSATPTPQQPLFGAIDVKSEEFSKAVHDLAAALPIPDHSDVTVLLQACTSTLCQKYNPRAISELREQQAATGMALPNIPSIDAQLASLPAGFDTGDAVLNRAVQALRLLFVQDLRQLQSQINSSIVQMQEYTANPKTDSRLGRVGR